MSFIGWLTDRLILEPTTHEIPVEKSERILLPYDNGQLEVWIHRVGNCSAETPDLYALKFPGTASRAENAIELVEHAWPDLCVEVWAVNPPGYGGSSGPPGLTRIPTMSSCALQALQEVAGEKPLLVAGGSLGAVSALYLAANHPVSGVLVQNPPALREVIQSQSGWWHFSWLTGMVAHHIPQALDCIANAARIKVPGVFVVAEQDRIVPAKCQQKIIDAYGGAKRVLYRPGADHDTTLSEMDRKNLQSLLTWLNGELAQEEVTEGDS